MNMDTTLQSQTRAAPLGLSPRTWIIIIAVVLVAGFFTWRALSKPSLPAGFAAGNGRLEANELFVAAKYAGRVKEVLVNEGDTVEAGQVVARMDTEALEAQLRQAMAQMNEARQAERVARADVATKAAQIASRGSDIQAKQADFVYASQQFSRSRGLVPTGAVSAQEVQQDSSQ